MTERITKSYVLLFEVRILHHFWLDDGLTPFDQLDRKTQEKHLLGYDVRSFFAIAPTEETIIKLRGLNAVWKPTAAGLIAGMPDMSIIPEDTVFEFFVTVKDPSFFSYTALTLKNRPIHSCYQESTKTTFRYKEHVPVWSSETGTSRPVDGSTALFLSRDLPATLEAGDGIESLVSRNGKLCQLTSDPPNETVQELHPLDTGIPVYSTQADVPTITPPEGVNGVPKRGIRLTGGIPDDVFGLIRLAAANNGNTGFDFTEPFTDPDGKHALRPKSSPPTYDIRLKNRSTFRVFHRREGEPFSTNEPLPMTFFGNASPGFRKPSPNAIDCLKDDQGIRTTRLLSNIFA